MDAHPKGEGPRGPALQHRAEYNRAVSCIALRFIKRYVHVVGWEGDALSLDHDMPWIFV